MTADRLVCMECGGELRRMTVTLDFHPLGHKNVPPTIHPPRPASRGRAEQPTDTESRFGSGAIAQRGPTVPELVRGREAPRPRKPRRDPEALPAQPSIQEPEQGRLSGVPPASAPGPALAPRGKLP